MFGHGSSIRIIGHRGAAGVAPENTLVSFERGVLGGAQAIEMDVHRAASGELVVFHDSTLDRTTSGSGPVEAMSLPALQQLDAGYGFTPDHGRSFPYRESGVTVPTLDQAVEACAGLPLIIEVKSAAAGRALGEWLRDHPARPRILVGGESRTDSAPAVAAAMYNCASAADLRPTVLLSKIGLHRRLPPKVSAAMVPVWSHGLRVVTRGFVRRTHETGQGVFVWTVNRPQEMRRLFDLGVDGLISDFPAIVRRIVNERQALESAA
ncbi:MAG: glycerophosphodiester phosphodiesterase [Gemmatimonadota bacterium]